MAMGQHILNSTVHMWGLWIFLVIDSFKVDAYAGTGLRRGMCVRFYPLIWLRYSALYCSSEANSFHEVMLRRSSYRFYLIRQPLAKGVSVEIHPPTCRKQGCSGELKWDEINSRQDRMALYGPQPP